jgi:hypothetical protein
MALCSMTTRKLDIPNEAGEWVEIRPISNAALREVRADARAAVGGEDSQDYGLELTQRLLRIAIVSWSYEPMPTDETIGDLDIAMTEWLARTLNEAAIVPLPSSSPSTDSSTETSKE